MIFKTTTVREHSKAPAGPQETTSTAGHHRLDHEGSDGRRAFPSRVSRLAPHAAVANIPGIFHRRGDAIANKEIRVACRCILRDCTADRRDGL